MKINVLIFPSGEINSIELHDALSNNVNIKVFGAASVNRHGPFVFENYYGGLPFINSDNFLFEFNNLISKLKIDIVFPTHDTVALYLAKNSKDINAIVANSCYETALICRDKKKTYDLFYSDSFCPRIFDQFKYPCFIKPRDGQGSKGTKLVNEESDIPNDFDKNEYVLCEYLPGNELTVDCITDNSGSLKGVFPRIRKRMLAGVCVSGETLQVTDEIMNIAQKINEKLCFKGLWYFQIKQDFNGKYKLLEISTRCAGTMCLTRARGVNLPLLTVYSLMGKDISVFENPYCVTMDRTLISRYFLDYEYDYIYIDYDDTIVQEDRVSLSVIRFLYQCKNKGKKIILISRHEIDHRDSLEESFESHSICSNLFSKILKISFEEEKYKYISNKNSIFIDNSYKERKSVHDILNIPVFDVEGIEFLLDWRE